jgi:hypothetical protein
MRVKILLNLFSGNVGRPVVNKRQTRVAAALNRNVAAEMNRNLAEVRQKNLLNKREVIRKVPVAFQKQWINNV